MAGERATTLVTRSVSMQSRLSNLLAVSLMSLLGLGTLVWYYANNSSRQARDPEQHSKRGVKSCRRRHHVAEPRSHRSALAAGCRLARLIPAANRCTAGECGRSAGLVRDDAA